MWWHFLEKEPELTTEPTWGKVFSDENMAKAKSQLHAYNKHYGKVKKGDFQKLKEVARLINKGEYITPRHQERYRQITDWVHDFADLVPQYKYDYTIGRKTENRADSQYALFVKRIPCQKPDNMLGYKSQTSKNNPALKAKLLGENATGKS